MTFSCLFGAPQTGNATMDSQVSKVGTKSKVREQETSGKETLPKWTMGIFNGMKDKGNKAKQKLRDARKGSLLTRSPASSTSSTGSSQSWPVRRPSKQSWALVQDSDLGKRSAANAKSKFNAMLKSAGTKQVSKDQLHTEFKEWGVHIQADLFERVFRLFDSDDDGQVNLNDFVAAYGVLTCSESASDRVELAFELFDSDNDGFLSVNEFNEMMASIIGSQLKNLLLVDIARKAFEEFLKKELCDELLAFLDDIGFVHAIDNRARNCTREYAHKLYSLYIEENGEKQINVSSQCRAECRKALSQYRRRAKVPLTIFDSAAVEAVGLLENGPLQRFKLFIRAPTSTFAHSAWDSINLDHTKAMTVQDFRTWACQVPQLFNFLDELKETVQLVTIEWGCKGAPKAMSTIVM